MKKMEIYLNVLHYYFYKAHYKLHLLANKINPFWLLARIPFLKRRHEELGIDVRKEIDRAFGDKTYGLSMIVAGGALLGFLFFFFFMIINFSLFLIRKDLIFSVVHFIVCGILSGVVSYLFVFKKDKYIVYFEKFETWTKADKRKYGWLTFAFIVIVFFLFIWSISKVSLLLKDVN